MVTAMPYFHLKRESMITTMPLPDIEIVAAAVHKVWMKGKLEQGVTSRKAEDGEELMVDYEFLSEKQKEQDRSTVRTVYAAIHESVLQSIAK